MTQVLWPLHTERLWSAEHDVNKSWCGTQRRNNNLERLYLRSREAAIVNCQAQQQSVFAHTYADMGKALTRRPINSSRQTYVPVVAKQIQHSPKHDVFVDPVPVTSVKRTEAVECQSVRTVICSKNIASVPTRTIKSRTVSCKSAYKIGKKELVRLGIDTSVKSPEKEQCYKGKLRSRTLNSTEAKSDGPLKSTKEIKPIVDTAKRIGKKELADLGIHVVVKSPKDSCEVSEDNKENSKKLDGDQIIPTVLTADGACSHDVVVPTWRVVTLEKRYVIEGTENLSDDVFIKRHQRPEIEEKRRKRWDEQRQRELELLERLQGNRKDSKSDDLIDDRKVVYIEVVDQEMITAFGHLIPDVSEQEFHLPWELERTPSTCENNVFPVAKRRRKAHFK